MMRQKTEDEEVAKSNSIHWFSMGCGGVAGRVLGALDGVWELRFAGDGLGNLTNHLSFDGRSGGSFGRRTGLRAGGGGGRAVRGRELEVGRSGRRSAALSPDHARVTPEHSLRHLRRGKLPTHLASRSRAVLALFQ